MKQYSFQFLKKTFKTMKTALSSQAMQRQMVG